MRDWLHMNLGLFWFKVRRFSRVTYTIKWGPICIDFTKYA